jgi:hypothetical protein
VLSRSLERRVDLGSEQVEVQLTGIVRVERMKAKPLPPGPRVLVQRGDDDSAAGCLLVELDGGGQDARRQGGSDAKLAWRWSRASLPSRSAGTGSGAPVATISGAAERSMPVIATLAYATTRFSASAMTQVAAVSRRRFWPA